MLVPVLLIRRGGRGLGRESEKKAWDKLGYVATDLEDVLRSGLEFKVIFVPSRQTKAFTHELECI